MAAGNLGIILYKVWTTYMNLSALGLHIIIFDEIDAICKARGSVAGNTGKNNWFIKEAVCFCIYTFVNFDKVDHPDFLTVL